MAKILLVEDDLGLAKVVSDSLSFEYHTVESVVSGEQALERLDVYGYDLVIVDWGLPGMNGLQVCREYRSRGGDAPLLMLTAKHTVTDKMTGLDAGFDDYVTKPFDVKELGARVRALLRRAGGKLKDNVLRVGDVELDPTSYRVERDGAEIRLSTKEFGILELLMRHPSVVFSAEAVFSRVWTMDEGGSPEVVRSHIKNLRKKLEADGKTCIIQTIHGVGYKAEGPR